MPWLPFLEAREFVRRLGLKKSAEYLAWAKTPERPTDIPSTPQRTYPQEWLGWQDWLGTGSGRRASPITAETAMPFAEAREYVHRLKLGKQKDYEAWAKTTDRPPNIPATPHRVYCKEWQGWADWLGSGGIRPVQRSNSTQFLSFCDAKSFMQQAKLKSQRDFSQWSKSDRPASIPSNPRQAYKADWKGWADFLNIRGNYRPFQDARDFARHLELKSRTEWRNYARSASCPLDIPEDPASVYRFKGWSGWGNFLGIYTRWNHLSIVSFLDSLKPVIEQLGELELYLILSRNGMLRRGKSLLGARILRRLTALRTPTDVEDNKQRIAEELQQNAEETENPDNEEERITEAEPVNEDSALGTDRQVDISALRLLKTLEDLKCVDRVVEAKITDDEEIIEFMVKNRVAALWQAVIDQQIDISIADIHAVTGNAHCLEIRDRFLKEYDAVQQLTIPDGYSFRLPSGKIAPPFTMQRLTAYRLLQEKRLGNWSGVGSGKTKAAILAAGILKAKFTLVLAANSTLYGWKDQITEVFPPEMVSVQVKERGTFQVTEGKLNFFVINYESLQQPWSEEFVRDLTSKHVIDFIVLDEVQLARQRHENKKRKSKRRELIESLIAEAVAKNPNIRILAMSATPIISHLREAIKSLELLRPEDDFSHVPLNASVANAVGVHMLLRQHGFRHIPPYGQQLVQRCEVLDGTELLPDLKEVPNGEVLPLEQTLLKVKLRHLHRWVRRGTLVFTLFVKGIVDPLTETVKKMGLKVHHFTGTSRVEIQEFVEAFRGGEADVLIGSAPVGTGVDKLQYVLDRLVFITLPWSNAEYQQVVGRLWRQGSPSEKVEVIIPQVTLREERAGQWSWDDLRLRCIEYKRTLADAALDGIIPEGGLPSHEELQSRSLVALKEWITRLESSNPPSIELASNGR